ncbi:hypothetical protein QJS10_CPB11g01946 [Acorus calamus]|uniref:Uncharacterized protein n=1 Tax=Acorus calamus TaxID=4465 RepID=A0AAV9DYB3_ACOCL|nr:hypothetical protein QJS10_CPB11g01946 [Acorus calamus]
METPSSTRRVTRSQTGALASGNNSLARMALVDVTNDSPIVGVALTGSLKTPSSAAFTKSRGRPKKTPSSGEALLRGQVKSLLQKVEEEAHLFVGSGLEIVQAIEPLKQETGNLSGFVISRALLFDSPEKSDVSDSSSSSPKQVSGALKEGTINELCDGLKNMAVRGGRHVRFIYNSDDEIEGEEEVSDVSGSPNVLRLKGLPTPKGKHLRFPDDDDDDGES